MGQARPLRAVFEELLGDDVARQAYAADPTGTLGDAGHGDLPSDLVAEALVSYADTAPPAVAEHLAPFVTAHSVVPVADDGEPPAPAAGLDLLATAPAGTLDGSGVDEVEPMPDWTAAGGTSPQPEADAPPGAGAPHLPEDLDFGRGAADTPQGQAGLGAGGTDPAPLPGDTVPSVETPAEPFAAGDVLPGGPAPYPDGSEEDDGDDLPE